MGNALSVDRSIELIRSEIGGWGFGPQFAVEQEPRIVGDRTVSYTNHVCCDWNAAAFVERASVGSVREIPPRVKVSVVQKAGFCVHRGDLCTEHAKTDTSESSVSLFCPRFGPRFAEFTQNWGFAQPPYCSIWPLWRRTTWADSFQRTSQWSRRSPFDG